MVANNVNHTKWATGETCCGFSLEFEEWSHRVKAIPWDKCKSLSSSRFDICVDVRIKSSPYTPGELKLRLCTLVLSWPPAETGWVMVSYCLINTLRNAVRALWIVHETTVLQTHKNFTLTCGFLFIHWEDARVSAPQISALHLHAIGPASIMGLTLWCSCSLTTITLASFSFHPSPSSGQTSRPLEHLLGFNIIFVCWKLDQDML